MKYFTAIEASKRIGVAERTVRNWIDQGKLKGEQVAPNRLAIPESEVKRIIRERSKFDYEPDATGYNAEISKLEQRIGELETRVAELEKLQRARMSESTSAQTHTYEDIPANAAPSESQKKTSSEQSVPKNDKTDMPDGCIHIVDFAKRYGVPDNTAKRHAQSGFKQPDGSFDKLEVESRPRPGRPGQTTYYLTPEQQERAIEFWRRNGVKISEQYLLH